MTISQMNNVKSHVAGRAMLYAWSDYFCSDADISLYWAVHWALVSHLIMRASF